MRESTGNTYVPKYRIRSLPLPPKNKYYKILCSKETLRPLIFYYVGIKNSPYSELCTLYSQVSHRLW